MLKHALLLLAALAAAAHACAAELPAFTIEEPIGHTWSGEVVSVPMAPEALRQIAETHAALVDETGSAVPIAAVSDRNGDPLRPAGIEILTDLSANGRHTYHFVSGPAAPAPLGSDVTLAETTDQITLENPRAGIRLNKRPAAGAGPIAAIRLTSGSWLPVTHALTGEAATAGLPQVSAYTRGLTSVADLTIPLANGAAWHLTVSLTSSDNALVVTEHWSAWDHPAANLSVDLGADRLSLYYRTGRGTDVGKVALDTLGSEPKAFELEPWLQWWVAERRGTWVAAFADGPAAMPDALVMTAIRPTQWISEAEGTAGKHLAPVTLAFEASRLEARFPGKGTNRAWAIAALPRAEAIDTSLVGRSVAPPPQQLRIKHSDLSLNDLLSAGWLSWTPSMAHRPRLMLTADDLTRIASQSPAPGDAERIRRLPLNEFNLGEILQYQLRTGDKETKRRISAAALPAMRDALAQFVDQADIFSFGYGPQHQRRTYYAIHLSDAALADPDLPQAEKSAILRTAAAIAYFLNRDDYWSPARGFAANPNMTSMVKSFGGLMACLLHDHPRAGEWLDQSLKELFDGELLTWSDDNGGWVESPHYALVSQDAIVAVLLCARNAGRGSFISHPRVRQVAEWLAKVTTPPDVRHDGRRFLNPLGDTYMHEPTGWFGTMAFLMRDIDPAFSARMQWMHVASGSPVQIVAGGFAPAFAPEQVLFRDTSLPTTSPTYGSELFPETGAVLRAHFGTGRETQLQIIAGRLHAHYAADSGSITLWGKGRLLANAWGYGPDGRNFADHSMPDFKGLANYLKPVAFRTGSLIDEFVGTDGPWTRRVALIKDVDPLGANLVLIDDTASANVEGKWRLWLDAARLERRPWGVEAIGRDDVDLCVVFPDGLSEAATFETATHKNNASYKGPVETTQTAIVTPFAGPAAHQRVVLFPRLKSDPTPTFTVRDNGARLDIASRSGTDTILFANAPLALRSDGIAFEGTLGLVRSHGTSHALAIGGAGRLEALGRSLDAAGGNSLAWTE